MPTFHIDRFEKLLQEGYPLLPNQCLMEGLQLYRRYFRGFFPFALLLPILSSLLDQLMPQQYSFAIVSFVLSPVLNTGFYWVANRLLSGQPVRFVHFFEGRFDTGKLILSNLIYTIILALVLVPAFQILQKAGYFSWVQELMQNPNPAEPPQAPELSTLSSTMLFINMIPLVYLMVGFLWAYPFIAFFGLGPWQALEASRRLISRNWWSVFMLLVTFFSVFLFAVMIMSLLQVLGSWGQVLGLMVFFGIIPWAYCSFFVGFAYATHGLQDAPPRPPAAGEEEEEEA
jgi:hypothetical protein